MKKVLIVDDDPAILQLLNFTLGSAGFQTKTAKSANEFYWNALQDKPDLIVLDIMLGEQNGPDVYDKLLGRGFDKSVPVIFLSALAADRPMEEPQPGRRYVLIGKPFNPQKLVDEIHLLMKAA